MSDHIQVADKNYHVSLNFYMIFMGSRLHFEVPYFMIMAPRHEQKQRIDAQ